MNRLFLERSWIEVSLEQIKTNYREYSKIITPKSEIMAVVKADAYGHGAVEVAKTLNSLGVKKFAVSNLNEAIELRNAEIDGDILILGYTSAKFTKELCDYKLTQTIISEKHAEELAKKYERKIRCQFAIDTGMNRIGLDSNDPDTCERIIRTYSGLLGVNGIFTHFCVADSDDVEDVKFTRAQINKFKVIYDRVKDLNFKYVHCCNSAGGMLYSNDIDFYAGIDNIVRLGIVLYGMRPNISISLPDPIKPALSWKTVVSMVKTVNRGEYIGYGLTYRADGDKKIATLPTGYADGYSRLLSNSGCVLIKGKRAPIVGRVCMDQMTVDVTDIPDVQMGDVVTLIGRDSDEIITADDIAQIIGTISYEIVCGISKRVQRIYNE